MKSSRYRAVLCLSVLLLLPSYALAGDGFSYTYAEISATTIDVDAVGEDADQYGLRLSLGLPLNFYLVGDYTSADLSLPGTDQESDVLGLGAGAHLPLPLTNFDVLAEIEWLYNSTDGAAGSDESSGYTAYVGARWMPFDFGPLDLELFGGLRGTDVDNLIVFEETLGSAELGLRAHVLFASAGLSYQFLEESDAIAFDLRASL